MKFVFFGTPDIASQTLEALCSSGFIPGLVVTNPDAAVGRKQVITPSPTKTLAQSKGIPVLDPQRLDEEAQQKIKEYRCDYAIVVAYGKILPKELIDSFPLGILNIHYSLLPKYRGASPVEAALLNDDRTTGVTIQRMVFELDAGDILAHLEMPIETDDTTLTLRNKLVEAGSKLLIETLPLYLENKLTPTKQDSALVTLSHKLKKADGEISLQDPDRLNWNKYRAYAAWPGIFFFQDGKRVKVTKAEFVDNKFVIKRVVPEGKKEQDW